MKESFNKVTDSRLSVAGRRVHCDLSGIRGLSIKGYRYWLLVIDDATRATAVRILKDKS